MRKRPVSASRSRALPGRLVVAYLLLGLAAASSGCANRSHYRPTQSGGLSDYAGLTKDGFHLNRGLGIQQNLSRNTTPDALERIDSFYLEPSKWEVDPKSRAGGDAAYRQALTSGLALALSDELGVVRPIVAEPGPRTARVRSVITDARLSRPYSNAGLQLVGVAGGVCGIPIPIGPIFSGGACVEAEIIDPDDRQIAAISCASGGGPLDYIGYFSRANHARKAMRRAAHELRETLVP